MPETQAPNSSSIRVGAIPHRTGPSTAAVITLQHHVNLERAGQPQQLRLTREAAVTAEVVTCAQWPNRMSSSWLTDGGIQPEKAGGIVAQDICLLLTGEKVGGHWCVDALLEIARKIGAEEDPLGESGFDETPQIVLVPRARHDQRRLQSDRSFRELLRPSG